MSQLGVCCVHKTGRFRAPRSICVYVYFCVNIQGGGHPPVEVGHGGCSVSYPRQQRAQVS